MPYDPLPRSDHHPYSSSNPIPAQSPPSPLQSPQLDHPLPSPPQFNRPNPAFRSANQLGSNLLLHPHPSSIESRRISHHSIDPSTLDSFDSAEDELIDHHLNQLSPSNPTSTSATPIPPTIIPQTLPPIPQSSSSTSSHPQNQSNHSHPSIFLHPAGPDLSSLSAIASGLVGGDYGPFPHELSHPGIGSHQSILLNNRRLSANDPIVDLTGSTKCSVAFNHHLKSRRPPSADCYSGSVRDSLVSYDEINPAHLYGTMSLAPPGLHYGGAFSETTEDLLWKDENKEPDDFLHDPDPDFDSRADRKFIVWSRRGWMNVASLSVLVGGLIGLFALYPILTYVLKRGPTALGWNLGGINGTGQFPDIPNLPRLIDVTTPESAKTRTGIDGKKYNLVFSDEFNTDNRTFWPGDDPFWEAVDIHYWQTTNFEWYDPDAITTKGGSLVIQMDQENIHDLRVRSGMLQSWNKFCFTEGYIEVNVSLPGKPSVQGLWPGAWTMGNLARAGFGASNEGMWPYSYEACDVGTLPNQTMPDGRTPPAAKTSGSPDYGGELSWLPGQRTSACTCKGEDHPGPSVDVGRSGPEIDILEAQYAYGPSGNLGSMSQSIQIAPMDEGYQWQNDSSSMHIANPATSPRPETGTIINKWHGSIWQESLSGITVTDGTSYEGRGFQQFGFEYNKGFQADGGRVTWTYGGQETWTIYANALAGQSGTQVSPRPISTEPMYVILNLGISNKFQTVEWDKLTFPAKMYIDYVRIYQREGHTSIGCSPKDRPTEDYIKRHLGAYTNANFTTWAQAGYTMPKNRLKDSC